MKVFAYKCNLGIRILNIQLIIIDMYFYLLKMKRQKYFFNIYTKYLYLIESGHIFVNSINGALMSWVMMRIEVFKELKVHLLAPPLIFVWIFQKLKVHLLTLWFANGLLNNINTNPSLLRQKTMESNTNRICLC
jgi:hypothetical protein